MFDVVLANVAKDSNINRDKGHRAVGRTHSLFRGTLKLS